MTIWQRILSGQVRPGVYRLAPRATAEGARRILEPAGWRVLLLDGARIRSKATFLSEAARAFQFPSYFGHNWDAFEESLNDLEWVPAKGYVVLFPHAGLFAQSPDGHTALAILSDATRKWKELGTPMYILLGGAKAEPL